MNITSKSRYALKIMMDLSSHDHELVRRQEIVRRQGVPAKYLDQILIKLRNAGLVNSTRGRDGGYALAREKSEITVWDILNAVEDGIYPVMCVDDHGSCSYEMGCITSGPWQMIFNAIRNEMSKLCLSELSRQFADEKKMCPIAGLRECHQRRSHQ